MLPLVVGSYYVPFHMYSAIILLISVPMLLISCCTFPWYFPQVFLVNGPHTQMFVLTYPFDDCC
jgi:hypothetical protein